MIAGYFRYGNSRAARRYSPRSAAPFFYVMAGDLLERSNALLIIGNFRLFARCSLFDLFEQTFPTLGDVLPKCSILGINRMP